MLMKTIVTLRFSQVATHIYWNIFLVANCPQCVSSGCIRWSEEKKKPRCQDGWGESAHSFGGPRKELQTSAFARNLWRNGLGSSQKELTTYIFAHDNLRKPCGNTNDFSRSIGSEAWRCRMSEARFHICDRHTRQQHHQHYQDHHHQHHHRHRHRHHHHHHHHLR